MKPSQAKRPVGLVLTCSVLGLLAAIQSLLAALMVFAAVIMGGDLYRSPQGSGPAVLILCAIALVASAAWSVLTAAGLLRLRNRARISVLVMAGLILALSLVAVGVTQLSARRPPPPGAFDAPSSTMQNPLLIAAILWTFFDLIAGWWLVYFSLASTRAYFLPGYQSDYRASAEPTGSAAT